MSTILNGAKEALERREFERAAVLAAIAQAEALEAIASRLKFIMGNASEGSINVFIVNSDEL